MNKKSLFTLIFAPLMMMSFGASAEDAYLGTTAGVTVIANLVVNVGTLLGLVLFSHGLYSFYARGENPNQYPVGYCFSTTIAGCFLLISSTVYSWSVNSVSAVNWASDNTMLAIGSKLQDDRDAIAGSFLGQYLTDQTFSTLMGFIFLVGLVGFIRGLYLFKNAGRMDNGQEGGFSQAFWHVVGGCAVMNIIQVSCFVAWLLGIPYLCLE